MPPRIERGQLRTASYLLLHRSGEVLLLERKNTGYEDGNYSLIAGHVEHGESPSQAIIREAREEAGITISKTGLEFVLVCHRRCPGSLVYVDYFFSCERWDGTATVTEPDKCGGLTWVPLDALPSNTIPYIRDAINAWQAKKRFLELGWD